MPLFLDIRQSERHSQIMKCIYENVKELIIDYNRESF